MEPRSQPGALICEINKNKSSDFKEKDDSLTQPTLYVNTASNIKYIISNISYLIISYVMLTMYGGLEDLGAIKEFMMIFNVGAGW